MKEFDELEALLSHPDYATCPELQVRAKQLRKQLWGKDLPRRRPSKMIRVTYHGKIVLEGTAKEIAARSVYSEGRIQKLAKNQAKDRFGKIYQYVHANKSEK